jgi:hypothetical protein
VHEVHFWLIEEEVVMTTSTYLPPDRSAQYEHFQWLAKQIRDSGGEATLVRAQEIEGVPQAKVISLFNSARDQDYTVLKKSLQALLTKKKQSNVEAASAELERLTRELREIDFFESPRGHEVAMLLTRAEGGRKRKLPRLDPKDFLGKPGKRVRVLRLIGLAPPG